MLREFSNHKTIPTEYSVAVKESYGSLQHISTASFKLDAAAWSGDQDVPLADNGACCWHQFLLVAPWFLWLLRSQIGVKGDFWFWVVGSIWPLPIYFWPLFTLVRGYRPAIAVTIDKLWPSEGGEELFFTTAPVSMIKSCTACECHVLVAGFLWEAQGWTAVNLSVAWDSSLIWWYLYVGSCEVGERYPNAARPCGQTLSYFSGTFYATNTYKCKRWTWSYMHV